MMSSPEELLEMRLARATAALCDVQSITGEEARICGIIEDWARSGAGNFQESHIRRVGNSLVLGDLSDTSRPMIALVGHLDTVPGTDFPARIENVGGKLRVTGLGSSDMKCGLAVMMALAEDLNLSQLPCNPVFVFYDREEGPYADNGLEPLLRETPELSRTKLAVVLESTDGEIQMACQGSLHALVTFDGKKCHSARPWHGENAIYKAIPLLRDLAAREPHSVIIGGFTFREVISATMAQGGTARNIIPETFQLNLNFRFSPGRTIESAMDELEKFIGGRGRIQWVDKSPAGKVCSDNIYYQRLAEITGAETTPKQAWTDVARLAEKGIDAVNYGPGLTAMAHQRGEWVPVDEISRCYSFLKKFLISC